MDAAEILKWPYGAFSNMVLDDPFDSSALAPLTPGSLAARFAGGAAGGASGAAGGPTPGRKLYRADDATLEGPALKGHYISNTDRNKGHQAEALFAQRARAAGFEVYQLPHFTHNYMGHVDFEVECPATGHTFLVDVKAPRALRRGRDAKDPLNRPQSQYACIELAPKGSLFGSKAHVVAYQLAGSDAGTASNGANDGPFVLVDRAHTVSLIRDFIEKAEVAAAGRAAWPEQSLWAPYVRTWQGVSVPLMYVEVADLKPFARL